MLPESFPCFIQGDLAIALRKSIKLHTESTIREAIHLFRISKAYKKLRKGHKNEGIQPSLLILFDNGYFTTVFGGGSLLKKFMELKIIDLYTGKGHSVVKPDEKKYHTARLRYLPFDRCFSFTEDDVNDRELRCELSDK